jgi:hypothetical protein
MAMSAKAMFESTREACRQTQLGYGADGKLKPKLKSSCHSTAITTTKGMEGSPAAAEL